MISITANFTIEQLEADMNADLEKWFDEIAESVFDAGKSIVDRAIAKVKTGANTGGGFGNITFNLRSSIGCGLVRDGLIKEDYFPFGKGDTGQVKGREVMNNVLAEFGSDQIGLILVAGEEYGVFVQMKGYDVTEMSWLKFEKEFFSKIKG